MSVQVHGLLLLDEVIVLLREGAPANVGAKHRNLLIALFIEHSGRALAEEEDNEMDQESAAARLGLAGITKQQHLEGFPLGVSLELIGWIVKSLLYFRAN